MLDLNINPSLSGTIPRELGNLTALQVLDLDSNPSLSGTIPRELGNLTALQKLVLDSNPSLSGTVPALESCVRLTVMNLYNCSFTELPTSLPTSITHLYLNHNPLNATASALATLLAPMRALRVLDVGFISSRIVLDGADSAATHAFGTRVFRPTGCHVGGACAFVLHMYDDENQPVRHGGVISDLTLALNGSAVPMVDNRDCTFTAAIPRAWIRRKGSYLFQFKHAGVAFTPMATDQNLAAVASDCHNPGGGPCTGLRTVDFNPRDCPDGSHTEPDALTGAECVCKAGFEPYTNTSGTSTSLSCHRSCSDGEGVSHDGSSCVCDCLDTLGFALFCSDPGSFLHSCICVGRTYDRQAHGMLICSTGSWDRTMAAEGPPGARCAPCPTGGCASCENGIATISEGWRLNSTTPAELQEAIQQTGGGRAQFVFSCPYSASDCRPLVLSGAGNNLQCPNNHTGPLCASCATGFSRRGSSDNRCEVCQDTSKYISETFGLTMAWFVTVMVAIALAVCVSVYAVATKLRWLWTAAKPNLRIFLGSAQVLSLLPSVLELVFPPEPKATLSFLAVLVADLREVVRAECWGWNWYDKWLTSVFFAPLVVVLPVLVRFVWRRCSAWKRRQVRSARDAAWVEAMGGLSFVTMLLVRLVALLPHRVGRRSL